MNIKQAKQEIVNTVHAYLAKDDAGEYVIPVVSFLVFQLRVENA